jgi:Type IV secretion system pilin
VNTEPPARPAHRPPASGQADPPAARRSGVSWARSAIAILLALEGGLAVWNLAAPAVAQAATHLIAVATLSQVISNLRNVIVGLLVGLATLFMTIGGVRYLLAGGDPAEVEAAKKTLKYAAVGYGVAVLAPGLVQILQQIVGNP